LSSEYNKGSEEDEKTRTPRGILAGYGVKITQAAACCAMATFRKTELRTFGTSSAGHTSLAPASSAAIHNSSSGIGQTRVFHVKNYSLWTVSDDALAELIPGAGQVHGIEVRGKLAGQRLSEPGIAFKNDHTKAHRSS
jgi:hypothetical protein